MQFEKLKETVSRPMKKSALNYNLVFKSLYKNIICPQETFSFCHIKYKKAPHPLKMIEDGQLWSSSNIFPVNQSNITPEMTNKIN